MIRDILASERQSFVILMYEAFKKDPLFLHIFSTSDKAKNKRAAYMFLSALFDMNIYLGGKPRGLFKDKKLVGCFLLEPAQNNWFKNIFQMLRSLFRFIPVLVFIPKKAGSFLNSYMNLTKKAAPDFPHTYLSMIGVHPQEQGQGIGKELMTDIIKITTNSKLAKGIALDTENKNNVELYRKWGFNLNSEINIDGIKIYCMYRANNSAFGADHNSAKSLQSDSSSRKL